MRLLASSLFFGMTALGSALAAEPMPPRVCLSAAETRDAVLEHKLVEPMAAVRDASRASRAEPLRSRLCQTKDGYQYELTLLRRDGKVLRLVVNAISGAVVGGKTPAAEHPRVAVDRAKGTVVPQDRPKAAER